MKNKVYQVTLEYKDVYGYNTMPTKTYRKTVVAIDEVEARVFTVAEFLKCGYDLSDIVGDIVAEEIYDGDNLIEDNEIEVTV